MTATARTEIAGAKEAIKSLRQIDPNLRKQFTRDAKKIVMPIIQSAKNAYPATLVSGTARNWSQRGNQKFPYSQTAAQRGLAFKVDTRKKSRSVLKVQQMDPAAAIVEIAGRAKVNPLGTALDRYGRASRFLWPAAEKELPQVTEQLRLAVIEVVNKVNREL